VNPPQRTRTLFLSACAGILVFGIVFAVLGTVFGLPAMRERLHLSLAQQGNLFLLLYFGIFCASLIVGPLIDSIGNKANLFVSAVLVTGAMIAFSVARSISAASFAATLLGLGGGGLNTCTNTLVSDLYGEQRGPMLNLMGIFFGIGALFVPLFAASIEGYLSIAQLFLVCGALAACCAVLYAAIPFPPARAAEKFSFRDAFAVTRYPGVMLLGFILFLESGNEASIGGWTSTYADNTGYSPRTATLVLAVYWAMLMLGRMIAARVLRGVRKSHLVLACGAIAFVGCAILLAAHSLAAFFIGAALVGVAFAPVFPTTLAIAGDRYPERSGTVFGLLFSVALIGGMLLPWAVGQVAQRLTVRMGMLVPGVGAIGITLLSAVWAMRERVPQSVSKS
jgi:MFS transporter, FHS family, glucose/mannose:H+ symporter